MSEVFLSHGSVLHARHGEKKNSFRYPVFTLVMNCKEETATRQTLRRKFFGTLSLRSSDYLEGKKRPLQEAAQDFLRSNCNYEPEEIWLQTFPRMFGYVFNPVSFWFCKRAGKVEAVLCEVNNTFGERHFYWIHPGREISSEEWLRAEKVFHVSPFFPVEGYYKFRFRLSERGSRVDISYYGPDDQLRLTSWVDGIFQPLSSASLPGVWGRYGWMTPLVVLRIHWQALRLWLKKVQFFSKPSPPKEEIT